MATVGSMLRAGALAAFAFALTACERTPTIVLRTDDAALLAQGEALYAKHCAACHGARLEGQPRWRERDPKTGRMPAPPHDATGHTWHHPDQLLFEITKHGVAKAAKLKDYDSAMPAFGGVLNDAEIVAVLSWIKSQWPPEVRQHQAEVDAAARRDR